VTVPVALCLLCEVPRSLSHTTLNRTPLGEWSARFRDIYLPTHNTKYSQISMPLAGFEPAIPASKRPQTHALDCASLGICTNRNNCGDFETLSGDFQRFDTFCVHYRIEPHTELACLSACFSSEHGIWRTSMILLFRSVPVWPKHAGDVLKV
jgi:hypothetical protein